MNFRKSPIASFKEECFIETIVSPCFLHVRSCSMQEPLKLSFHAQIIHAAFHQRAHFWTVGSVFAALIHFGSGKLDEFAVFLELPGDQFAKLFR